METQERQERRFIRLPEVLKIIPVSKSTFWAGVREGRFPKPVKLSVRTSAWLLSDIYATCDRLAGDREE
jgi:prophage regulatory protein